MLHINPRRLYVWIIGGGLLGLLVGLVRGEPDTGLLLGLLFGPSARFLALQWLWRPRQQGLMQSENWQRLLTRLQEDPRLRSSERQEGDDDSRQQDAHGDEGDGSSRRDLEDPGGQGAGPGSREG